MKTLLAASLVLPVVCSAQAGVVNLSFVGPQSVDLNEVFSVSLMGCGNDTMMATDVIFGWNPSHLQLIGVSHEGSHPLMWASQSGLRYPDFYGINESALPSDGTALYTGFVQLGQSINAATSFQIAAFQFRAVDTFASTDISIISQMDILYPCETAVYGGGAAGTTVTGSLAGTTVVPSAGAIYVLGMSGLFACRRRRK